MHRYDNLQIWKKSTELCLLIYKQTKKFPEEERFGLTNQLRRAAVSVPSNIAEGSRRTTKKDFNHFLLISSGSLAEIETQLFLAKELNYLRESDYTALKELAVEISKMITSFSRNLI
jgi:four helix bundle protein